MKPLPPLLCCGLMALASVVHAHTPASVGARYIVPLQPRVESHKSPPRLFPHYEPHQAEEIISYLIVGTKQAVLFDTGMGIADIHKVVRQLTSRPVVVLNSHTHNDHVGGNSLFSFIYGMDTPFTRANAKGSRDDAQAEIAPGMICGDLPKGFN